ncbi:MAG: hypothetical protein CMJ64_26950 [Planctomycetaceae bacterium]|nr:hypothetical protein [Planctomycetaceae bacterium]
MLERRMRDFEESPEKFVSWEEVKRKLLENRK